MNKIQLAAVSALFLSGISMVQAATFNNSVGLSAAGIGITPNATLNFNATPGLSTNSAITTQYAFAGISFSSPAFYDGNSAAGNCNFNDFSGDCVSNYSSTVAGGLTSTPASPFSILFATPQTYAAFALVTDNNGINNTVITAYRNNIAVDNLFATTGSGNAQAATVPNYFGFYGESTAFDRITLTASGANLVIIDNLQYQSLPSAQSAPEPATMGMLALGIGGVVAIARRRRSA